MDDYEQIRQLTYRYAYAVDLKEVDLHRELWTDDAILDFSAVGLNRLEGIAQITAYFEYVRTALKSSCHLTSNHLITVTGDGGHGTCYWRGVSRTASDQELLTTGIYTDSYVRAGDGWRFRERICRPLNRSDLKDLRQADLGDIR
jgi:ketosteroid isomerase-like protein